jgi:hypothetical protein
MASGMQQWNGRKKAMLLKNFPSPLMSQLFSKLD